MYLTFYLLLRFSLPCPTPPHKIQEAFGQNKLKREQCSSATVAQRERERERGGKRGTLGAINSVHRRWCQLHVMAVWLFPPATSFSLSQHHFFFLPLLKSPPLSISPSHGHVSVLHWYKKIPFIFYSSRLRPSSPWMSSSRNSPSLFIHYKVLLQVIWVESDDPFTCVNDVCCIHTILSCVFWWVIQ